MEEVEEGKFSNLETPYQGGFSMSLMLLDKQDFESVLTDNHVVESEERNFGKYEGVYLRYQDLEQSGSYNQRIYLMCRMNTGWQSFMWEMICQRRKR